MVSKSQIDRLGDPHIPYGGRGQSGNGSRIGGPANWDEFTQWQWITLRDAPPLTDCIISPSIFT